MMVLGMQVQPASIRGLPHFFSFSRTAAFGSDSSSGTGTTAATLMTISSSFDGSQHKQAKATIPEIRPYHREAPTPPPPPFPSFLWFPSLLLPFHPASGGAHTARVGGVATFHWGASSPPIGAILDGGQRQKTTSQLTPQVSEPWPMGFCHSASTCSTHWSTRKLAAELGGDISHMTVARIWAKHGLKPHRLEGYLASNDPD